MPQVEISEEEANMLECYAPSRLRGPKKTTAQLRQVLADYFTDCEAAESVEEASQPVPGATTPRNVVE